jgi:hypothetical protein
MDMWTHDDAQRTRAQQLTVEPSKNLASRETARNRVSCCMLNSNATSESQDATIMSIWGVMGSIAGSWCSRKPKEADISNSVCCAVLGGEGRREGGEGD